MSEAYSLIELSDTSSSAAVKREFAPIGFEAAVGRLRAHGLAHRIAEDERFDGRVVTLGGRAVVNFGSCSYLGLETDARLKLAACEAVLRYGTQFSSSRAYLAAPLYRQCEELLSQIAGGFPVVLAPSTSLAHQAALPVLVGEDDAVLYDLHVHSSVQAVLPTLRARGIACHGVAHANLERLARRVRALSASHSRVFYLCDGVYSMQGSSLDLAGLHALLEQAPSLFAYIDDAHGVGWSGRRGAGTVLGRQGFHERMVVVLGLAKAFAACGGALVLPNRELAERVLLCGSTLIFSGPLQPAQLGACVASAELHLSEELPGLQDRLLERIAAFDESAERAGVPLASKHPTPIRVVPVGDEDLAMGLARGLLERGYFVNTAIFPAVPRHHAAIRLMLNNHQTLADIRGAVEEIAHGIGGDAPTVREPLAGRAV